MPSLPVGSHPELEGARSGVAAPGNAWSEPAQSLLLAAAFFLARSDLLERYRAPTFGWRPAELAGIALRYARGGFHFAYPQVIWGGDGPGYVEMEFPLQPYLTAILFKLFGEHDTLCLVVPLVCGLATVFATASIARQLYGGVAATAAGLVVAIAPTLIMSTDHGMYPDPPMLCCGTVSLALLVRWNTQGALRDMAAGVAFLSLAILLKLNALYLGIPVAYLFATRYRRGWLAQRAVWLSGIAALLPPVLWYWHAHTLYRDYGNTFGILGAGYSKFSTLDMFFDAHLYERTTFRMFFYHLTPLGALALAVGLYRAVKLRERFVLVWLASAVLHTALVLKAIRYAGHVQYLLPMLPVCAVLAGLGARAALSWLREKLGAGWTQTAERAALPVSLLAVAANAWVANHRFVTRDRAIDSEQWALKQRTGLRVGALTSPGSMIIVADDQMDKYTPAQSMTPPDVFFYADRLGWYLSLAWLEPAKIEDLRSRGADYFVVSMQSVEKFKAEHGDIQRYLEQHYKLVSDEDGLTYSLR